MTTITAETPRRAAEAARPAERMRRTARRWRYVTNAGAALLSAVILIWTIIPIYNIWVLLEIVGRPGWWLVLMLIPFVNFIVLIILSIDVAKSFGKGTGFGLGLAFLSLIFYPILGFGDAKYQGPAVTA